MQLPMIYRQNDNRENVDMIDIVQPIVHARNIGSTPQFLSPRFA